MPDEVKPKVDYTSWGDELVKVVSKVGEVFFTALLLSYIVACWWNQLEVNSLAWAGLGVFGANFGVKKLLDAIKK